MSKEDDKQNLDGENYEIEIEYVDEFGRPISPPPSGMPAPFGPPPPMPFGPPPPSVRNCRSSLPLFRLNFPHRTKRNG